MHIWCLYSVLFRRLQSHQILALDYWWAFIYLISHLQGTKLSAEFYTKFKRNHSKCADHFYCTHRSKWNETHEFRKKNCLHYSLWSVYTFSPILHFIITIPVHHQIVLWLIITIINCSWKKQQHQPQQMYSSSKRWRRTCGTCECVVFFVCENKWCVRWAVFLPNEMCAHPKWAVELANYILRSNRVCM